MQLARSLPAAGGSSGRLCGCARPPAVAPSCTPAGPASRQPTPPSSATTSSSSSSTTTTTTTTSSTSSSGSGTHPRRPHAARDAVRRQRRGLLAAPPRAAAAAGVEAEQLIGPQYMDRDVAEILEYAMRLCWTAETYEVHSWMLLLAVLKREDCLAAQLLVELGLDDLYAAWHEVLWALQVSDGLQPRAFRHRLEWGERARAIAQGAVKFAGCAGRDEVRSQDLLLAFAASDVLGALFPDLDLSLDRVKRAIERRTGEAYDLPNYEGAGSAVDSQDMFL